MVISLILRLLYCYPQLLPCASLDLTIFKLLYSSCSLMVLVSPNTNLVQLMGGISTGKPTFLGTVTRASNTITLMHGQTNDGYFDDAKGTFSINLGVDNTVHKQLSVVNPARFVVLLKLEEDCQPMKLKLTLAVTYCRKHRGMSEPLSKRFICLIFVLD